MKNDKPRVEVELQRSLTAVRYPPGPASKNPAIIGHYETVASCPEPSIYIDCCKNPEKCHIHRFHFSNKCNLLDKIVLCHELNFFHSNLSLKRLYPSSPKRDHLHWSVIKKVAGQNCGEFYMLCWKPDAEEKSKTLTSAQSTTNQPCLFIHENQSKLDNKTMLADTTHSTVIINLKYSHLVIRR